MITINTICESTYIINKSKFISLAYPVFDEDECKKILTELREKYLDATHICFAYLLECPQIEKCSDDGEPSGTAGKPLLELLKKRKLNNVLLVVVRYFGGIKLGAGGLVRAYTNSGNMSLDLAKIIEMKEVSKYRVFILYEEVNKFKNMITSLGGTIKDIKYNEQIEIEFLLEDVSKLTDYNYEKIGSEKICL